MTTKPQMETFSTRLPADVREALQAKAKVMGLTESVLGRQFIIEKLAESETLLEAIVKEIRSNTALTIAAQSETIDIDQAREIVAQHNASESAVTP